MKTKLIQSVSREVALSQVDFAQLPNRKYTDALACRQITALYPIYIPVSDQKAAEAGNRVAIRISSSMPKYNRAKVTLTIGKGLYDQTVETALIGLKTGDSGQVEVKGETVTFTILSLEAVIFPEPTDEMVAAMCMDGVSTVEQYKDMLFAKLRRDAIKALGDQLIARLVADAQFAMDEGDVDQAVMMQYSILRNRMSGPDMDLDTMPDDEWERAFYQPDKQEQYKMIYPFLWKVCVTKSRAEYLASLRPYAVRAIQLFLVLCELLEIKQTDAYDPLLAGDAEQALIEETYEMLDHMAAKE